MNQAYLHIITFFTKYAKVETNSAVNWWTTPIYSLVLQTIRPLKYTINQNIIEKDIINLLECTHYSKQYIQKSEWSFNFQINNKEYRIKSLNPNKFLPVEHFCFADHDFKERH